MNSLTQSFRVFCTSLAVSASLLSSLALGVGQAAASSGDSGAVFVLTNDVANAVAVFNRAADGTLSAAGSVATNGTGGAAGLGSQGALALSRNHKLLFAVNAGSNEISAFTIKDNALTFAAKVPSNGVRPVSLTINDEVLYVLNQGDAATPGNISGFSVSKKGELTPIAGATQPLSSNAPGASIGAAQISFDDSGDRLVVTEKATNKIDLYDLNNDVAQPPVLYNAQGSVPYGFAINKHNIMIDSEAATGSMSSYDLSEGTLNVVTSSSLTHQAAPCWVVVTKNGKYAYTTNAGSGTISGYAVKTDGDLSPIHGISVTASVAPNVAPVDMGLSKDSDFLYALTRDPATNMRGLSVFAVQSDGGLLALPGLAGSLPAFAVSVASY